MDNYPRLRWLEAPLSRLSNLRFDVGDEIAKISRNRPCGIFEIGDEWRQSDSPLTSSVVGRTGLYRFSRVKAIEDIFENWWTGDKPSLIRPPMISGFR
jgi:hypothetical protein